MAGYDVPVEQISQADVGRALSMVPFVPFVVLAGNSIATSSEVDLALLDAAIALMRPVAISSPLACCICNEAEDLYRLASSFIDRTI